MNYRTYIVETTFTYGGSLIVPYDLVVRAGPTSASATWKPENAMPYLFEWEYRFGEGAWTYGGTTFNNIAVIHYGRPAPETLSFRVRMKDPGTGGATEWVVFTTAIPGFRIDEADMVGDVGDVQLDNDVKARIFSSGDRSGEDLADGSITGVKLALGSIGSGHISNGSITVAHIQDVNALKTAMALDVVQNLDPAGQVDVGLTSDDVSRVGGVLETNVRHKVNTSVEVEKVSPDALDDIPETKLVSSVTGEKVFTEAVVGQEPMLKTGLAAGARIIKASDIANIISADNFAINLDLRDIAAGTLADIPQTEQFKTVTANEKVGAGRAYTYIDSDGYFVGTGISDGDRYVGAASVIEGLYKYKMLHVPVGMRSGSSLSYGDITFAGDASGVDIAVFGLVFVAKAQQIEEIVASLSFKTIPAPITMKLGLFDLSGVQIGQYGDPVIFSMTDVRQTVSVAVPSNLDDSLIEVRLVGSTTVSYNFTIDGKIVVYGLVS